MNLRILAIAVTTCLVASLGHAFAQGATVKSWFDSTSCTKLEITKYRTAGNHEVVGSLSIDDGDYVQALATRISGMPADGAEMIKMGASASYMTLVFSCGRTSRTIEIYNHQFKTPSTGFNTDDKTRATEKALLADVEALLSPALGTVLPKVKGLPLHLAGLTMTFTGKVTADGSPATLSATTETYTFTPKSGAATTVHVVHGQTPPRPATVTVGKAKYTLWTFRTKQGNDLFPGYIQLTK